MNQAFENVDNCVNFKKQQQNSAYFEQKTIYIYIIPYEYEDGGDKNNNYYS